MSGGAGKRILLLGADGFIGRHIAFHLRENGYQVLCSARNINALKGMGFESFQANLTDPQTTKPEFWQDAVKDCDAIINSAGLLNGTPAQMQAVHVDAPKALASLAAKNKIKFILISATGIEADTPFGNSKRAGEEAIKASGADHVILRPSMVLADSSYGGSSLLRALAAKSFITPLVGSGEQIFDPIHADDLGLTVREAIENKSLNGKTIYPCGPERVTQKQMLIRTRCWLGLKPVPTLAIPFFLSKILGYLGDILKLGPISSTAVAQLEHGVDADYAEFHKQTGLNIRSFSEILQQRPAGTQDLWHARLYLAKPAVRFALAFMWLVSGIFGFIMPAAEFTKDLAMLHLPEAAMPWLARGFGTIDLVIAFGMIFAIKLDSLAKFQLLMVGGYTIGLTLLAPNLWLEPYGGLLKNIPVLMLILIHVVLEKER